MADQNDLNKPDLISNYSSEVLQTIKGHITRLWTGDYTGMGGLMANMRRWVDLGSGDAKLVKRNADGSESTIFDSSTKANKVYVDAKIADEASARNYSNSSEVLSRTNADTALQNAINSEAIARVNADNALSNEISAESNARSNAINLLNNSISSFKGGLGTKGELWKNVTTSRLSDVNYINQRGYPIAVCIWLFDGNEGTHSSIIYFGGTQSVIRWTLHGSLFAIVPPGESYGIGGGFVNSWSELY